MQITVQIWKLVFTRRRRIAPLGVIVPLKVQATSRPSSGKKDRICALDPGGRTFQVGFSETKVFKIQQDKILLENLHKKLDFFKSLRSKPTQKPTWKKVISKSH